MARRNSCGSSSSAESPSLGYHDRTNLPRQISSRHNGSRSAARPGIRGNDSSSILVGSALERKIDDVKPVREKVELLPPEPRTSSRSNGSRSTARPRIRGNDSSPTLVGSTLERKINDVKSVREMLPPAPRACFGRDHLIESFVGFAAGLQSIALTGAGGTGKTSIALAALHHYHIRDRFGDNRRFIRCDQFPVSCGEFLARLSKAIGAGVESPESLKSLLPFLSSREMIVVLDNAESILDPQGIDSQEIHAVLDELCQLKTMCLFIVSRTTTVPQNSRHFVIPKLSRKAACDIFNDIHTDCGRPDFIGGLLQRLDFHPLSITLLAAAASQNAWDDNQLVCHLKRSKGIP